MAVARRTGSMLERVVSRSVGSTQASSRAAGGREVGGPWRQGSPGPARLPSPAHRPLLSFFPSCLPSSPPVPQVRTLIEPGGQVLQDVIFSGQLRVILRLGALHCLVLVLWAVGAGGGQRQQGVGPVQEAWGWGEKGFSVHQRGRGPQGVAEPSPPLPLPPGPGSAHRSAAGSGGSRAEPTPPSPARVRAPFRCKKRRPSRYPCLHISRSTCSEEG